MSAESASGHLPLILIEGVLFFGGALAFGWWQLRSIARDQAETRRRREAEAAAGATEVTADGPATEAAGLAESRTTDQAPVREAAAPGAAPADGSADGSSVGSADGSADRAGSTEPRTGG